MTLRDGAPPEATEFWIGRARDRLIVIDPPDAGRPPPKQGPPRMDLSSLRRDCQVSGG